MKPFSMRLILKDTCNNHSFLGKKNKNKACVKWTELQRSQLLKPFQEEQQSPMGPNRCGPPAPHASLDGQRA